MKIRLDLLCAGVQLAVAPVTPWIKAHSSVLVGTITQSVINALQ